MTNYCSSPLLLDIVQRQSLVGQRVSLPCNTSNYSNEPEDGISLIFWYKIDPSSPGPGITIYSIDARSNYDVSRANNKHFIADHLKGRIKFDIKYPSVSNLIIDNVTIGDEGEYRCRVSWPFTLPPCSIFDTFDSDKHHFHSFNHIPKIPRNYCQTICILNLLIHILRDVIQSTSLFDFPLTMYTIYWRGWR